MSQVIVGDYIEHWENGIGKIIDVNESIIVNFRKGSKDVTFPIEQAISLKKLNPDGFYVKLYENKEYIEDLIQQGSTELIKLLIMDVEIGNKRTIDISRIKTLLVIGSQSVRGWRKDFGLIKKSDWSKWWQKLNKKLSNDPWFDTSLKPFISLREQPISTFQNIYNQFVTENIIAKKLRVAEKLIDVCDIDKDRDTLQIIQDYIVGIIITSSDEEIIHIATYNAIQLAKKGVTLKPFDAIAYELSFKALTKSALPYSHLALVYKFLSALPIRNINDQILIYISIDNKMRKVIAANLKKNKELKRLMGRTETEQPLTEIHIDALNNLSLEKEQEIISGLIDSQKVFGNQAISKLILDILLVRDIDITVREIFTRFVLKHNMTNLIYGYFNKIRTIHKNEDIPFISEFLKLLGNENADIVYKQILLTVKSLSERPNVFLAALRSISTESSGYLNNNQNQSLLSHVNDILSNSKISINSDLRLEIIRIMTNTQISGEVKISYDNQELNNIVRMKLIKSDKRLNALSLLINQGLKDDCINLARDIITGIIEDDFIILENIIKAFPDEKLTKQLFSSILKEISISQEKLIICFQKIIFNTNMLGVFSDLILTDKNDDWFKVNSEKINYLLNDQNISRSIIHIGLREYFLKDNCSQSITKRLSIICSKYSSLFLEEMRDIYFKTQEESKSLTYKIKEDFIGQINRMVNEHESQRIDAINRTSQRYEEYLKRIIPHLDELEMINDKIKTGSALKNKSTIESELLNKLTIIKQDIEGILKILGIIVRD